MSQINQEEPKVQVKELKNGTMECFSFEMPKGELTKKHIEAYIRFLQENEISEVLDALMHIYFTAINDKFFEMDDVQKVAYEHTMRFLAKQTSERVFKY